MVHCPNCCFLSRETHLPVWARHSSTLALPVGLFSAVLFFCRDPAIFCWFSLPGLIYRYWVLRNSRFGFVTASQKRVPATFKSPTNPGTGQLSPKSHLRDPESWTWQWSLPSTSGPKEEGRQDWKGMSLLSLTEPTAADADSSAPKCEFGETTEDC